MDKRHEDYSWWKRASADFSAMEGATILGVEGLREDSEAVQFVTDRGVMTLWHEQDCCELVTVESVNGAAKDIIGGVVATAEEREDGYQADEWGESMTWTFYAVRTTRGDVTIRWCGSSNGYYSESVDVCWIAEEG